MEVVKYVASDDAVREARERTVEAWFVKQCDAWIDTAIAIVGVLAMAMTMRMLFGIAWYLWKRHKYKLRVAKDGKKFY